MVRFVFLVGFFLLFFFAFEARRRSERGLCAWHGGVHGVFLHVSRVMRLWRGCVFALPRTGACNVRLV